MINNEKWIHTLPQQNIKSSEKSNDLNLENGNQDESLNPEKNKEGNPPVEKNGRTDQFNDLKRRYGIKR